MKDDQLGLTLSDEITPEMIEAGVQALSDWSGIADFYELAQRVYIAMDGATRE